MAQRGDDLLEESFGAADPAHFEWRTTGAIGPMERSLVRAAFLPLEPRILDVGCGDGATLLHLGAPEGAVGVDLFEDKLAYARRNVPGCEFRVGSAYELPFDDRAFDQVLVRDLIHHLETPARFLDECARVLAPGGRVDVLEPCRYNPLVFAHGLLLEAERGELRSTRPYLEGLLAPRFEVVSTQALQALPLHRILYHPRFGWPPLARVARPAVAWLEALADRVVPEKAHAYLHLRARVREL